MDTIWEKVERKRKSRNSESKSPSCASPVYKRLNMASPATDGILSPHSPNEHNGAHAKTCEIEQLLTEGGNKNEALTSIASFMKELSIDVRKIRDSQTKCRAEISQISEYLVDVDEKLNKCNVAVEVIHEDLGDVKVQNNELRDKQRSLCANLKVVDKRLVQIENKMETYENQGRKNNLVLYDIPEEDNETWEQTERKVCGFVTDELKIPDPAQDPSPLRIDRAYRMGPKRRGQTRPILVRFLTCKDKNQVLYKAMKGPRNSTIRVNEDYSKKVRETRRDLYPYRQVARTEGKHAIIKYDKLYIDNVAHVLAADGTLQQCIHSIRQ